MHYIFNPCGLRCESLCPPVNTIISHCGFLCAKLLFWTGATLDTHFSHCARHWVLFSALHSCRGKTPNPRLKEIKPVGQMHWKMWWIPKRKWACWFLFSFVHQAVFLCYVTFCFSETLHWSMLCFSVCLFFLCSSLDAKVSVNIYYCPKQVKWEEMDCNVNFVFIVIVHLNGFWIVWYSSREVWLQVAPTDSKCSHNSLISYCYFVSSAKFCILTIGSSHSVWFCQPFWDYPIVTISHGTCTPVAAALHRLLDKGMVSHSECLFNFWFYLTNITGSRRPFYVLCVSN